MKSTLNSGARSCASTVMRLSAAALLFLSSNGLPPTIPTAHAADSLAADPIQPETSLETAGKDVPGSVSSGLPRPAFQRWLWIELIGFDNTQKDFGVGQFLAQTGFVPDAVSFLLFSPDFIHTHAGMGQEWAFPPEYCSYGARPYSKEHARQVWTNYQLKGLIGELQRHHIQVYCSFFNIVGGGSIASGKPQWLANNNVAFPVTLTLTLPALVKATKLEVTQSDWPSGDYRSGDFAVDVLQADSEWKEIGRGRLPNLPAATASIPLPALDLNSLRIRILNTLDTNAAMSCGLRRIRLWAGTNEISLTSAKVTASSTIPGHEEQQTLADEKEAAGSLAFADRLEPDRAPGTWANRHSEIFETRRAGERYPSINPLRRFQDKTYYEDFFLSKLVAVMRDYGFDGYHGADGYSCGRQSLLDVDYSEDMVEQFVQGTGIELPPEFSRFTGGLSAAMEQRADWIWNHRRADWIRFYSDRWERFWRKVVTALHSMGKKVVFNTAWTRDPFEALYRYGVDYQRIAQTGVDGFIVETVASAVAVGEAHPKFHYDALAMLLLIKAYAPQVQLRPFTLVHDTLEQWDALRHAPTVVEREIYSMANLFWRDGNGAFQRCSAGPMVCLSDSIRNSEWRWLQDKWTLGFSPIPQRVKGATLVWSDRAFAKQLPDFLATRRWTTHKLLYELMARGAPIYSVVNINAMHKITGPVLIPNPHLLPPSELNSVRAYKGGPIILIGGKIPGPLETELQFEDVYPPNPLWCGVTRAGQTLEVQLKPDAAEIIPDDLGTVRDSSSWMQGLYLRQVSEAFLQGCVRVISSSAAAPRVLQGSDSIRLQVIESGPNRLWLFIGNDSFYYVSPRIDLGQSVARIKVLTHFPGMPVTPDGSQFSVKVPGRGMVVLEVVTGQPSN